jgi:hypothetical protein
MSDRTPAPLDLEAFADLFELVSWKHGSRGFTARCPSHDDRKPSLSVDEGDEQPVLLFCHAGCHEDDVLDAVGVKWADFKPPATLTPYRPPTSQTGWTADVLLSTELPEQRWAVPGLLPAGLVVLAGAPKVGKSWLLLDLCLRVAMGSRVLGVCPVEPGPTLYLALEDTPRRLQSRSRMLLKPDEEAPSTAHLHTSWPRMGEGGADLLRDFLAAHPDTRVVAVDVLSRIRDLAGADRGQYDADYEAMTAFKRIADDFGVCVLVNHHDRKAKAEDWLTTVSGTRGVTGAADAVMLLTKPRGTADGLLSITGRDVEEDRHALKFDKGQWAMLDGPVQAYTTPETRARILAVLTKTPDLRPVDVADRLDGLSRENIRRTLARMVEDGQVIADSERRYRLRDSAKPVPAVPVSQPVTWDRWDSSSGVTGSASRESRRRRRGEPAPVMLKSVTGCSVEEWLAGIEKGYPPDVFAFDPDTGTFPRLERLADYCDPCADERQHRPQAFVNYTAFYVCDQAHAWAVTYADLDLLWEEPA